MVISNPAVAACQPTRFTAVDDWALLEGKQWFDFAFTSVDHPLLVLEL